MSCRILPGSHPPSHTHAYCSILYTHTHTHTPHHPLSAFHFITSQVSSFGTSITPHSTTVSPSTLFCCNHDVPARTWALISKIPDLLGLTFSRMTEINGSITSLNRSRSSFFGRKSSNFTCCVSNGNFCSFRSSRTCQGNNKVYQRMGDDTGHVPLSTTHSPNLKILFLKLFLIFFFYPSPLLQLDMLI